MQSAKLKIKNLTKRKKGSADMRKLDILKCQSKNEYNIISKRGNNKVFCFEDSPFEKGNVIE